MTASRSVRSLAEMMFLIAHDEASGGEPLVRPELVARAVMGALVADLAMKRRIRVLNGYVWCADNTRGGSGGPAGALTAPVDAVGNSFLHCVATRTDRLSVRRWLGELAADTTAAVARQLVEDNVVGWQQSSRWFARQAVDSYPPVDLLVVSGPRLALAHCFRQPTDFDLGLGVLAALVAVAGLQRFVDPGLSQRVSQRIMDEIVDELMQHMPADLREIIDAVG